MEAAAEANKKKKGGRGKKKKGSWDLLAPKDRQTRFWVEQFGRDSAAGNAEAAKLQKIVDKKTEENRKAKENWEKEVKKMLKFLYQMDKKVGSWMDMHWGQGEGGCPLGRKLFEIKQAGVRAIWSMTINEPYDKMNSNVRTRYLK